MSKVLSALNGALPDERPLLSLQIVETVAKCPTGYVPVSRTYDEDSDAGLLRQNGLFGKKPSHYICLSKSEGVPGYVMDGIAVVGEREAAPPGYSVAGRAGKRRLCTRVSRGSAEPRAPRVTDVIVCSRMRQAPQGFILAGEINGKMVCYKVSGGSVETSPTHAPNEYENIVTNITPEANRRLRSAPERPPKLSPIISDLKNMNVSAYPDIEEFTTAHDYEALSPSYNIKPARPAPRPPSSEGATSPPAPVRRKGPAPLPRNANYQTLGGYSGLEGVPFVFNPKLRGLPNDNILSFLLDSSRLGLVNQRQTSSESATPTPAPVRRKGPATLPRNANYQTLGGYSGLEDVPFVLNPILRRLPHDNINQFPMIKKRTQFELDRDYSYAFTVERQT